MADVNQYFAENSPALAYKVMRYTSPENPLNYDPDPNSGNSLGTESANIRLFVPGGRAVDPDSLPMDKSVLVLHQGLECSGCVKAVYTLLSQSPMDGVHIGQVYPQPLSGLSAHELGNRIRQQLDKPFALYYDTTTHYRQFSPTLPFNESDFPCVILFRKGEQTAIYRNSDLFTPNYSVTEFNDTFLDAWRSFLSIDH
jgi:hypothetical protein